MTAWQATLRRRFDRAAEGYEALAQLQRQSAECLAEAVLALAGEQAASALTSPPGSQSPLAVLDLGCGTGWLLRHLLQRWPQANPPELFGLDLSEGMLQSSAWQAPGLPVMPARLCADAARLPVAAACMDVLVSNFALHWCDDLQQVLAEMHRVTRPGGQAFCVIPVAGSLSARGGEAGQGAALRELPDWQRALDHSPWTLVSSELQQWVEHHPTPEAWLQTLRALGVTARRTTVAGLAGRAAHARLLNALEQAREPAGIPLRYQVWRVQLYA